MDEAGGEAVTAPRPLPPCPICRRPPREWRCSDVTAWGVICSSVNHRPENDHEIYVIKPTRSKTSAAWRRLAGGKR